MTTWILIGIGILYTAGSLVQFLRFRAQVRKLEAILRLHQRKLVTTQVELANEAQTFIHHLTRLRAMPADQLLFPPRQKDGMSFTRRGGVPHGGHERPTHGEQSSAAGES